MTHRPPTRERRTTYGEVFAVAEFRTLFGSVLTSSLGDELARLALTLLVYARTDSALLAAVTFGVSYLPWVLGGPVLSSLADRLPRHRVMITSDVARAVLVAVMAVPGVPLPVLIGLMLLASLCAPPFESARSALSAVVLEGDRYAVGTSVQGVTLQLVQVVGFLLSGVLVHAYGASAALLVAAGAYAASAALVSRGLVRRPAPAPESGDAGSVWSDTAAGLAFVARAPRLLAIVGVLWLGCLFLDAPTGLASGLSDEFGGGSRTASVLVAASSAGTVVGGVLVGRFCSARRREALLVPLVLLSLTSVLLAGLAPRVLPDGRPTVVAVTALFVLAGIGGSWTIPLNVAFVQAVPDEFRGRAFGVAVAGLSGSQGLGIVLAGLAAEAALPSTVVAGCGALGLLAVLAPLVALVRTRPRAGAEPAATGPSGA
ncbi:MFS transporter [Modestobacter sp. I12A-02628]|uniref:MFS transporter n=1 Tax=Goekera deserti TaxID=2497753 RepID=A0A7K3WBC6_9ACTN|nr:MFS transporter [Goekera deserti]MPQ97369.1 MFS transporter [Goekera deserti]NDI48030.1 MFS transporter [Goekera deserti]NEL53778.1 MFS transporter [Goekera deserti]